MKKLFSFLMIMVFLGGSIACAANCSDHQIEFTQTVLYERWVPVSDSLHHSRSFHLALCRTCGAEYDNYYLPGENLPHTYSLVRIEYDLLTQEHTMHYNCDVCDHDFAQSFHFKNFFTGDSFPTEIPATGAATNNNGSATMVEGNILTIIAEDDENTLSIPAELYAEWKAAGYVKVLFVVGDVTVGIHLTGALDAGYTMEIHVIDGVLSVYTIKGETELDVTLGAAMLGITVEE